MARPPPTSSPGVVQDYQINQRRSLGKLEDRIRLHLASFFGRWNAASVTDDLVRDFIVRRQAAQASNAINRELAVLRRGYSLATKTVPARPAIPKLKAAQSPRRILRAGAIRRRLSTTA